MTELEFKVTDPSAYGTGNINILYSSSVSTGSVRLPVAQYGSSASEDLHVTSSGIYERIEFDTPVTGTNEYYRYNSLFL